MRILVAEDDPISSRLLERTLEKWGYEIVTAQDGNQAWEAVQSAGIRLVVTDWMMPETDGASLCKRIREADLGRYVYIIILTARNRKEDVVAGLAAGADDYLVKPFQFEELRVRLKAAERILRLEDQLMEANRKLAEAASTDSLTGLLNRRTVLERLAAEMERSARQGTPLSLTMIDLDHFKCINDRYGHQIGDCVLAETAARIKRACRPYDLPGRYGGDELLLITPDTNLPAALRIAERMRLRICEEPYLYGTIELHLAACFGVAEAQVDSDETLTSLILRADRAAYRAKEGGRNRVVAAEPYTPCVMSTSGPGRTRKAAPDQ